jgi:hypothetical protein
VHWYGRGRKGENPREVKTQERIGSNRQGNTGRMDARTLVQLKPLKATPPAPCCMRRKPSSDGGIAVCDRGSVLSIRPVRALVEATAVGLSTVAPAAGSWKAIVTLRLRGRTDDDRRKVAPGSAVQTTWL